MVLNKYDAWCIGKLPYVVEYANTQLTPEMREKLEKDAPDFIQALNSVPYRTASEAFYCNDEVPEDRDVMGYVNLLLGWSEVGLGDKPLHPSAQSHSRVVAVGDKEV